MELDYNVFVNKTKIVKRKLSKNLIQLNPEIP